jgi:hypothetical protein
MVDIPRKTIDEIVAMLGKLHFLPDFRHDADDLIRELVCALERDATSPAHPASMMAELLEAIGQTSGRSISTVPSLHSLRQAREALAELAPSLGTVIALPRAVSAVTKADIAAEVSRQVEQLQRPISFAIERNGRQVGTADVAALPRIGERMCVGGERLRVVDVVHSPATGVTVIVEGDEGEDRR